ncbi:MAG: 4-hydroxy-tetrahydrodipicolinate synthase [Candidatus Melainabacteria bacterium RIFCSPLOWO2_02_FULL_35_15]|nr:MAG: 4-hydroxy-tetrahydrodipicolinate synthase [Candidatus Melainabacteria bacterium RIFCSPLOWO2_12_FULL_35_11]OGI13292.1 MAG: 4-hydroxy-tetrahydrodipicolinate synthase [Candidatus Melainabacteria bacterium RIFCSPLOWO2_02_FULL_35_15]
MQNQFGQVITAMVTPFKSDLSIDFESTEKLVNHLIKNGTDTICVAGTTGENPTLTHEEERELCKFVQKIAHKKTKIILGAGSNSTATAIESTKAAEKLGVDGVLSVVPYYNKPSQEGMFEHFGQIAKSTSLPIILYNIPGRTGINMEPQTAAELAAKYKNIVGYKDATGNLENTSWVIQLTPKGFLVFSGDDSLTLPMLSVGAAGVISVASHIAGNEIKDMINSFFTGKIELAKEIHNKFLPLFKALFKAPNPTCIKAVLEIKGLCKSNLRPPLIKLNEKQLHELKEIMSQIKNHATII